MGVVFLYFKPHSHFRKYQKGKQFHQQRTSSNETSVYVCNNYMHAYVSPPLTCILYLACRLREVDHFQKVLEHSAFIKDPMSAITEHINNSVVKSVL